MELKRDLMQEKADKLDENIFVADEMISKLVDDYTSSLDEELNAIRYEVVDVDEPPITLIEKHFTKLANLMNSLPEGIANQLMLDRDPHGNVQVSLIETEKLLIEMIKKQLSSLKKANKYGGKFSPITHFFGYEGRCGVPSNFDANYTYALGFNASVLALNGLSGYLSSVRNLTKKAEMWACGGIPLTMMMNVERRNGKDKPVIKKALVELKGEPFKYLAKNRKAWEEGDEYLFPGPIQFFGPSEVVDITTHTLKLEHKK